MIDDWPFPVKLRRSRRAKKLSLTVDAAECCAKLVLPFNVSLKEGRDFLNRESKWVLEEISKIPPRKSFSNGAIFTLLGERCKVQHLPLLPRGVRQEGIDLVVGGYSDPNERIIEWLKCVAGTSMRAATSSKAQALNLQPPRMSIRDPRGSWGSCSEKGTLSFSWRLVLAPPWIMDYVISHEVAHLLEFNHRKEFWILVAKLCPRYKGARRWLEKNGRTLLRYG